MNNAWRAKAVRRMMEDVYPLPVTTATVTAQFADGKTVEIPVYFGAEEAKPRERIADGEANVLQHIPPFDQPGIAAEVIRRKSGYRSKSHFMKIMKRLRETGKVIRDGDGKYRKPK